MGIRMETTKKRDDGLNKNALTLTITLCPNSMQNEQEKNPNLWLFLGEG
jgi:hypothetical protein